MSNLQSRMERGRPPGSNRAAIQVRCGAVPIMWGAVCPLDELRDGFCEMIMGAVLLQRGSRLEIHQNGVPGVFGLDRWDPARARRIDQNKTTRSLARVPGRLDSRVVEWPKTQHSHISMWLSSSISCSRLSIPVRQNGLGSALFRRNPRGGIRLASA